MPDGMLGRLPLSEVRGPRDDLETRLAGADGEFWLQALKRFLRKEDPWVTPDFTVWKTIKLGIHDNLDALRSVLKEADCKVSDWAYDIIRPEFTLAREETEVKLIVISVAELGFPYGARRDQIYARAQEFGLALCPPEVGPQLRLQYSDQTEGEWLLIGMEPITDSNGFLDVFGVDCGVSELLLSTFDGNPDSLWGSGCRWVFLSK
jgi:hypothetical protein